MGFLTGELSKKGVLPQVQDSHLYTNVYQVANEYQVTGTHQNEGTFFLSLREVIPDF